MAAGTPPPELQTVQDPIMAAGPPPPPESSPSTATPPPPPPSSSGPPPPKSSPSTATPPPPPPSSSGPSPPPESSPSTATPPPPPPSSSEHTEKWGTHVMGQPANPNDHPDNQKAASWNAAEHQQFHHQQSPYLLYSPVDKPTTNPLEPVIHFFNSWTTKADTISRNIWHNLKTGSSVTGAAWGKVNLTAKAITEGGFESMFKQIFSPSDPNEKLKKTFACYLSTSTGPVAGTIYLSTARIAFCSDRPLSFTAPSGQETWSYYKVVIPLGNVGTVNPVTMREKSSERYIQIVTVDGHDFWFMGFVNYEKASMHLMNSLSEFNASVAPAAAV